MHLDYAHCIAASKRVRWDLERDVLRGRGFDFARKFLPDALSRVADFPFLRPNEARFLSQVQGRTYARMFALFERFIAAKVLDQTRNYWMGDQVALEALVRSSEEELKHQDLFRRLDALADAGMPEGYRFLPRPDEVALAVLARSTWAVLSLIAGIETFTQVHYRMSIAPDPDLSELWKDVFRYHWIEEVQHARLAALEWRREDALLEARERDRAIEDLESLLREFDGVLRMQAEVDADYFLAVVGRRFPADEALEIRRRLLGAYRWQYLRCGFEEPSYRHLLNSLVTPAQLGRIMRATAPFAG